MPPSSASPDATPSSSTPGGAERSEALPLLSVGLYELLQVPPTATAEQLRQSFRRLSKRYHPDTTSLPAPAAAQAFQRLKRAYGVLSDPRARRLYDAERQRPPLPAPPLAGLPATGSKPVSPRRMLSGGEWFALLLLALALALSLVLGIGVAWARGAELVRWPSWWADLHPAALAATFPPQGSPGDGIVVEPQSPLTADGSDDAAS
ncbi:MAG: DnaJ domain-containing protein [Cyanobacteriota bacterium]